MIDVDGYFSSPAGWFSRMLLAGAGWLVMHRYRRRQSASIPLTADASPTVDGLKVIRRGEGPSMRSGLIVGTVRMGYGHLRIAASAYSWALARGIDTYLHDLLAIESPEADHIARIDRSYSRLSRLASDLGGPADWLWGRAMSRGNLDSLRLSCRVADEMKVLAGSLNVELPYIASYPFNGQLAISAGFQRVVNLVVDNYPQYFLLVPGAMNLVQTPRYYTVLRQMGLPSRQVDLAGHWVHHDIVTNLVEDSTARIRRAREQRPRRVLMPIGGAGAQKKLVSKLLAAAVDLLRQNQARIYLNTGDHRRVHRVLIEVIERLGLEYQVVQGWDALQAFCAERHLGGREPADEKAVTVFHFEEHFQAFAATDRLIRVADVLATKPSELAFCPIPKLHLRRVGDHEAASALRSAELGDGTFECRTVKQAAQMLSLLCLEPDLFIRMNECILRNGEQGIYDGSKVAVELASSL